MRKTQSDSDPVAELCEYSFKSDKPDNWCKDWSAEGSSVLLTTSSMSSTSYGSESTVFLISWLPRLDGDRKACWISEMWSCSGAEKCFSLMLGPSSLYQLPMMGTTERPNYRFKLARKRLRKVENLTSDSRRRSGFRLGAQIFVIPGWLALVLR